jgi:glucokinase-like ROK family protein
VEPSTSPGRPVDQTDGLHVVLDLIRGGVGRTRPELVRHSGLGRKLVTQRVDQLIARGLVTDGELGPSTGGRAPRELQFTADAGVLLVAEVGWTSVNVGMSDLTGRLLEKHEEKVKNTRFLNKALDRVEALFDRMLAERAPACPPVWGIGVGVIGPVNAATGRPAPFPNFPGWVDYPVRDRLVERYDVPVWVDNEVNLMALGEFRAGLGRGESDVVFIKIGGGIGAGIICGGRLHRGADGAAGEIGHIAVVDDESVRCFCGNTGCVAELAGGTALARLGAAAAESGRSPRLAAVRSEGGKIDARAVAAAAAAGDNASLELLTRAGHFVGKAAASVVNIFNPTLILIGGGVAGAGDLLLAAIREAVYRYSLPLSTRNLRIAFSPLSDTAAMVGAAHMVLDALFSPEHLGRWIDHGSPAGRISSGSATHAVH